MQNVQLKTVGSQFPLENKLDYKVQNSTDNLNFNTQNSISKPQDSLTLTNQKSNEVKDGVDDGKISFGDKLKNFGKGLIKPITTMFSSPKNFLMGIAAIAGGALLIAAVPAAAPIMVAAGVVGGGLTIGKGIYKASTAKTDAEAEAAFQDMGTGTFAVGASVLGSKQALKGAGLVDDTANISYLQATKQCLKSAPKQMGATVKTVTSGEALANLKGIFKTKTVKAEGEEAQKVQKNEVKESKPEQNTENKVEIKKEEPAKKWTQEEIEAEAKARVQAQENAKIKAEEGQAKYNKQFEDNLSHKSAKDSANIFEEEFAKEVEAEVKARTLTEIESKRMANASQEAYKQSFEKNLSNKSAKDSANIFEEEFIKQELKAQKEAEALLEQNIEPKEPGETCVRKTNILSQDKTKPAEYTTEVKVYKRDNNGFRIKDENGNDLYETIKFEYDEPKIVESKSSGVLSSDDTSNSTLRHYQYDRPTSSITPEEFKEFGSSYTKSLAKRYLRDKAKGYFTEDFGHEDVSFYEYILNDAKETIQDQLNALKDAPVNTEEGTLYRGISINPNETYMNRNVYSNMLLNAKEGDIIVPDWCTTCTAPTPDGALGYSSNALMRIKTPVGAQLAGKSRFGEIDLPSMAHYKFLGKTKIGDFTLFDLEYIMPDLNADVMSAKTFEELESIMAMKK